MTTPIPVLTAGGTKDTVYVLTESLKLFPEIEVVGTVSDAAMLAEAIKEKKPAAVVCDEYFDMLHGMKAIARCGDALGEELPLFMITVSEPRDLFLVMASEMDIVPVPKPYDVSKVVGFICDVFSGNQTVKGIYSTKEKILYEILDDLGLVPESLHGTCLRASVMLAAENLPLPANAPKCIFMDLRELYDISLHRASRLLDIAVRLAHKNVKAEKAAEYFPGGRLPRTGDFIRYLAEKMLKTYFNRDRSPL